MSLGHIQMASGDRPTTGGAGCSARTGDHISNLLWGAIFRYQDNKVRNTGTLDIIPARGHCPSAEGIRRAAHIARDHAGMYLSNQVTSRVR
jgi:hypothetical protein